MAKLTDAKKGMRVKLANGMMGTIVSISSGYFSASYSIRPDGGKHKTRSYNADGVTDRADLAVEELMSTDLKAQLDEAKAKVQELSDLLNKEAQDGYEEAMIDFDDGNGAVKARRHLNPEGDFGGYVALTAKVDPSARISRGSVVFGSASVSAGAKLKNQARVGGTAKIGPSIIDGIEVMDNIVRARA
jgi:hypothetical protein